MPLILGNASAAEGDQNHVLFLIGLEFDSLWRVGDWLPVAKAGSSMFKELDANADVGLIGRDTCLGQTTILIEYWRSLEDLQAYALDDKAGDFPAWRDFQKTTDAADSVRVWHEAYEVKQGEYTELELDLSDGLLARSSHYGPDLKPVPSSSRSKAGKVPEAEGALEAMLED